jgi:hypothetical protein
MTKIRARLDVRMILWNANDILTHVIGMRQLVVAATKRKDPNQSKARSFVQIDSSFLAYQTRKKFSSVEIRPKTPDSITWNMLLT